MRKYVNGKGTLLKVAIFTAVVLLMALTFHACQQDEEFFDDRGVLTDEVSALETSLNPEIFLDFPSEVTAGEDFDITFSSSCGKIMIERGFTAEFDAYGAIINKVYAGLTCDTENLLWEAVGDDVFEACGGATITGNLTDPGTYVYRAKLNFKAMKKSGCPDCVGFVGNKVECFMITVVEVNQTSGTFIDGRDGHEYMWVKIGDQIWMAENLAYQTSSGSYVYGNVDTYGRLYTLEAAQSACPEGWRLPSDADWNALITYLSNNGYGCDFPANIARTLAAPDVWPYNNWTPGAPGYPFVYSGCTSPTNSSGFSALPAGYALGSEFNGVSYVDFGLQTWWWSSTDATPYGLHPSAQTLQKSKPSGLHATSVRCIKN